MTKRAYGRGERWAIILSGGEGARLSLLTTRRYGEHRPKQYCAFHGRRTMFDHTMSRAVEMVGPQRVVTVIGRGHMRFLESSPSPLYGYAVEQPRNCETAPGIFLPLSYVMAYDPDATVLIFPSDHFVRPNALFLHYMGRAAALCERHPGRLVLAAAVADRAETEYGWIQAAPLGDPVEPLARSVLRFHEKPGPEQAESFLRAGLAWNTFNMAVKAAALWTLGWAHHPRMMERFEALRAAIGAPGEGDALARAYAEMESVNFSTGILERAVGRILALPMPELHWSDWGRPERIEDSLQKLGSSMTPLSVAVSPRESVVSLSSNPSFEVNNVLSA